MSIRKSRTVLYLFKFCLFDSCYLRKKKTARPINIETKMKKKKQIEKEGERFAFMQISLLNLLFAFILSDFNSNGNWHPLPLKRPSQPSNPYRRKFILIVWPLLCLRISFYMSERVRENHLTQCNQSSLSFFLSLCLRTLFTLLFRN